MDAFFASVEQRDDPSLRGKPVVVGFDGPRGVVSTASYEARAFGVRSAMPMARAKQMCPGLVVVPSRFDAYKEASGQIHRVFHEYTDLVEPLSLDEAFLDVTENKVGEKLAMLIAKEIKAKILRRTGLTASAGVSYNKFLAKVASDYRKPDGLSIVHPDHAMSFIDDLPVEKFWGVGAKTAERMHAMGVFCGRQLRELSLDRLLREFGKAGRHYYDFSRGIDHRPVITVRERKSVGCEHTFIEDICVRSGMIIELYHTVLELVERISKSKFEGKTLTLKVRYADFTQVTRSASVNDVLRRKDDILPLAKLLLAKTVCDKPVRLIGLTVSNPFADSPDDGEGGKWFEGELEFEGFS